MKSTSFLLFLLMTLVATAQKQSGMTVYFDLDKYKIRPDEELRLDSLFNQFLSLKRENISIEIYGHCDNSGSETYNRTLSWNRVKAVERVLVEKGVSMTSIKKEEGFGYKQPLNDQRDETQRAVNRRVELLISIIEEKKAEAPVEKPVETAIEKPVEAIIEKTLTRSIEDTAVKIGDKIMLKNLNFYGGQPHLLPQSMPILDELLKVMKNNPGLFIAIQGHVCCLEDGSNASNSGFINGLSLSEERAKTVYNFLLRNGISSNRISYRGFGHKFPVYPYPEKSEQERVMNRRVEILIVSK